MAVDREFVYILRPPTNPAKPADRQPASRPARLPSQPAKPSQQAGRPASRDKKTLKNLCFLQIFFQKVRQYNDLGGSERSSTDFYNEKGEKCRRPRIPAIPAIPIIPSTDCCSEPTTLTRRSQDDGSSNKLPQIIYNALYII